MAMKIRTRAACKRAGRVWRKGSKGRKGSCARPPRKRGRRR